MNFQLHFGRTPHYYFELLIMEVNAGSITTNAFCILIIYLVGVMLAKDIEKDILKCIFHPANQFIVKPVLK